VRAGLLWITTAIAVGSGCDGPDENPDDDGATLQDDDDSGTAGDDDTTGIPADDDTGDDDTAPPGPCPAEMALVERDALRFCIDRWEASNDTLDGAEWSPYEPVTGVDVIARAEAGVVPQAYISGDQAEAACLAAGKRLCSSEEWLLACRGPDDWTWPYEGVHIPGQCNDDYASHPVVDYYGTSDAWVWTYEAMNDPGINQQPGTVALTGSHPDCVSAFGVFDLVGNLHEWVADADGTFRGGFYVDVEINGPGCTYATTAHSRDYHDYSTGFRCCGEAAD